MLVYRADIIQKGQEFYSDLLEPLGWYDPICAHFIALADKMLEGVKQKNE